jgi:hypothetical protein
MPLLTRGALRAAERKRAMDGAFQKEKDADGDKVSSTLIGNEADYPPKNTTLRQGGGQLRR